MCPHCKVNAGGDTTYVWDDFGQNRVYEEICCANCGLLFIQVYRTEWIGTITSSELLRDNPPYSADEVVVHEGSW